MTIVHVFKFQIKKKRGNVWSVGHIGKIKMRDDMWEWWEINKEAL